jgi:molybdopterin molybdotransferase
MPQHAMMDFMTAQEMVLKDISLIDEEWVPILDSLGRILARDICALEDLPGCDNSAMDGYAVRAADLVGTSSASPVALKIVEEVRAGHPGSRELESGQAIRIMTGGVVPLGADAVIKEEDTERNGDYVLCKISIDPGSHIRRRGESARAGQAMLIERERIGPAEIGLLAALGHARVSVYRKAAVAIISTGDELIDLGEPPLLGKIFSSNSYALAAYVLECGGIPSRLRIARDDVESLTSRLEQCGDADVIITSGGVSVGKYDLVKRTLEQFGVEVRFWKVAIKPGKPVLFGKLGSKAVFGLPGNPGAAMITFEQFVRPALLKMMRHREIFRTSVEAEIDREIQNLSDKVQFLRCKLRDESGHRIAEVLANQSPAAVRSGASSDGLIVLPPHFGAVLPGETVPVQVLS